MITSHRTQDEKGRNSRRLPFPNPRVALVTWLRSILIQEGRLANQPALLVEMAGIEPASEEFDGEHLQA